MFDYDKSLDEFKKDLHEHFVECHRNGSIKYKVNPIHIETSMRDAAAYHSPRQYCSDYFNSIKPKPYTIYKLAVLLNKFLSMDDVMYIYANGLYFNHGAKIGAARMVIGEHLKWFEHNLKRVDQVSPEIFATYDECRDIIFESIRNRTYKKFIDWSSDFTADVILHNRVNHPKHAGLVTLSQKFTLFYHPSIKKIDLKMMIMTMDKIVIRGASKALSDIEKVKDVYTQYKKILAIQSHAFWNREFWLDE
jgi:hypothetical protein